MPVLLDHSRQVVGFPRVLELLAGHCATVQGRRLSLGLEPSGSLDEARGALDEVEQLDELTGKMGFPPVGGLRDVEGALKDASIEGATLEVDTLLEVRDTVACCRKVHEYLEDAAYEASPLGAYAEGMVPLYELEERFDVQIPEEKIKEIATFSDVIEGLATTLEAKG